MCVCVCVCVCVYARAYMCESVFHNSHQLCRICIATEFHDIMLYFILPLVQPYLPVDHFHHFAVLITAITILLSESTENETKLAGILLDFLFIKWSLSMVSNM